MAPCAVVQSPVLRDEEVCGPDLKRVQQRRIDDIIVLRKRSELGLEVGWGQAADLHQ